MQEQEQQPTLPTFSVTTRQLVEQLMTLPADLLVLNADHLIFLSTPPQEANVVIKSSDIIILP